MWNLFATFVTRSYVHTFLLLHLLCFLCTKEHATYSIKLTLSTTEWNGWRFPSFNNTYMRTRVYVYLSVCHTYLGVIFGCHIVKNARGEVSTAKWERATMILLMYLRDMTHSRNSHLSSVDRGGRRHSSFNIARCIAISSTLLHKGIKRSINHSNEHVRVVLLFFFFNTRNFLSFLSFFSNRRWNYGNVLLTKENLISTDSPRIVQFITVKRICNINNY